MVDVEIRKAVPEDAPLLAYNLRAADVGEMAAYGYPDPLPPVARSAERSMLCWSAFVDGEMAAMLGVGPVSMLRGIGAPWMMGTPLLDRHIREMIKRTPEYLGRMEELFPVLTNWVYAGNRSSKRWLRAVGFDIGPAHPMGPRGQMFQQFRKG